MKKKLSVLFLSAAFLVQYANAQVLTVNGSVKDDSGNTVSLALVQDKSDKTATRTDSLGRFILKANPNSTLVISSAGFETKVLDLKGNTDVVVILKSDKGNSAAVPQVPSAFNSYTANNGTSGGLLYGTGGVGGLFPVFHPTEDTKGSRYLFTDWVQGYVVSPEDSVFKNPNYGFNYDKIGGGLLLTQDRKSVIEIDPSRIKSFTLYNNLNQAQTFEYVPDINRKRFPQLITSGSKYKIYKLTTTKLEKNNFHSDGMTSTGNNYDEYVDDNTYYVLNLKTRQLQELSLKKKSIKAVFANEGKKVDAFFDSYKGSINDTYLKSLGDYMNQ